MKLEKITKTALALATAGVISMTSFSLVRGAEKGDVIYGKTTPTKITIEKDETTKENDKKTSLTPTVLKPYQKSNDTKNSNYMYKLKMPQTAGYPEETVEYLYPNKSITVVDNPVQLIKEEGSIIMTPGTLIAYRKMIIPDRYKENEEKFKRPYLQNSKIKYIELKDQNNKDYLYYEFDMEFTKDYVAKDSKATILKGDKVKYQALYMKDDQNKMILLADNQSGIGSKDKNVIELSHLVDFTICSLDFAEYVTNIKLNFNNTKSVISIYESLKNMFKNNIIVTLGEFGALYYYENKIKIMKSITVDSIDTTGAGDIFHGAFVYGTCQKMSLENIIKLSNVTAALSTTKYGSSISIPTKKEVKEKLNEYR